MSHGKVIQMNSSLPTTASQSETGGSASLPHIASLPAPLDQEVQRMADAMMGNPVYRITNRETAMAYFRANALTRLMATKGNAP
jgi:hypothetical protein